MLIRGRIANIPQARSDKQGAPGGSRKKCEICGDFLGQLGRTDFSLRGRCPAQGASPSKQTCSRTFSEGKLYCYRGFSKKRLLSTFLSKPEVILGILGNEDKAAVATGSSKTNFRSPKMKHAFCDCRITRLISPDE